MALLDSLFARFPSPLVVIERQPRRLALVNDAARRALGLSADPIGESLPSHFNSAVDRIIERLEGRAAAEFDFTSDPEWPRALARRGRTFEVESGAIAVLFEAEAKATDTERFWDSVLEFMPQMVMLKDADELRIRVMSRAWETELGLTRAALLGKNDFDLFPREQAEWFRNKDLEVLAAPGLIEIPREEIAAPVGQRTLRTRKIAVRDANGNPTHLLLVSEDVTERVNQETELRSKLDLIESQRSEIERLSAPVLEVGPGILAVPIAGTIDPRRGLEITSRVLNAISTRPTKALIVDLTSVEVVDTATADQVGTLLRAVGLMGVRSIVSGIQPAVAQTMVDLGVETETLLFARNLRDAIQTAQRQSDSDD